MKTLAKSLHTVTVLVNVAKRYIECERYTPADAVLKALEDLGYADCDDPYGLRAKAVHQINGDAR
jgi:hypothetical protein